MEVEFAFRKERSSLFGEIYRPVTKVVLANRDHRVPEIFYVDSGADITLIPRSVGEILAFDNPTPAEIIDLKGIGGKGVPMVVRKAAMFLGGLKISSRIGWALIEDVPLLLGREDFFKYFEVTFSRNRKTIFESI